MKVMGIEISKNKGVWGVREKFRGIGIGKEERKRFWKLILTHRV